MAAQKSNYFFTFWISVQLAILMSTVGQQMDVIVAQDSTGNYTRIADAVMAAPNFSHKRYYIGIKEGRYTENIIVRNHKTNIAFVGDGMDKTIITGSKTVKSGLKTYDTATVGVQGTGFIALYLTFENTAGPNQEQAVAFRSDVEAAFYRCRFLGYQDTLYPKREKQFYRECEIYGTIDFIFGDASVVLQNCAIFAHLPLGQQSNTITAQGRTEANGKGGTVIHNCTIMAAEELPKKSSIKTYLGRPWKDFSRTVIMQSFMDDIIDPKGWLQWSKDNKTRLNTIFYAEFDNRGPGATTTSRVHWPGYRVINRTEAQEFTVRNFIEGDTWIPGTGIPYDAGLI